ncbi:MAG TPA: DNA repair protein RecO [bacterium]|nr:DNA repair protein RecO [bacterium]
MPVYKAEAIVIRRTNLGEADRLVTLYTRDRGKIATVAKGARKPKSRFAGRLELFTHLRALLAIGKTLDVVSQIEVVDPHAGIRTDLQRMGHAAFIAEVTDRATADREAAPELFAALRSALHVVAAGEAELAALWYAAQVLVLTGHGPVVDRCVVCGRGVARGAAFSLALGGALCQADRGRDAQAPSASAVALAAIGFLREAQAAALSKLALEHHHRDEVAGILQRYLEYRLETRLKSPTVIEKMRERDPGKTGTRKRGNAETR